MILLISIAVYTALWESLLLDQVRSTPQGSNYLSPIQKKETFDYPYW